MEDSFPVLGPDNEPTGETELKQTLAVRVIGTINEGGSYRLKIARGLGMTRPVVLGFDDVIQRQGIWAWRGFWPAALGKSWT